MKLWRITSNYFVAGLFVADGKIVSAAPILGRYIGKEWRTARRDMKAQGWHGAIVPSSDPITEEVVA